MEARNVRYSPCRVLQPGILREAQTLELLDMQYMRTSPQLYPGNCICRLRFRRGASTEA